MGARAGLPRCSSLWDTFDELTLASKPSLAEWCRGVFGVVVSTCRRSLYGGPRQIFGLRDISVAFVPERSRRGVAVGKHAPPRRPLEGCRLPRIWFCTRYCMSGWMSGFRFHSCFEAGFDATSKTESPSGGSTFFYAC